MCKRQWLLLNLRCPLEIVKNDKGTLVVGKRYTSDVLHLGMAGESVKDNVEFLIVSGDDEVGKTQGKIVGRGRGVAGQCTWYMVAGHSPRRAPTWRDLNRMASLVGDNCGTLAAQSPTAPCPTHGQGRGGAQGRRGGDRHGHPQRANPQQGEAANQGEARRRHGRARLVDIRP